MLGDFNAKVRKEDVFTPKTGDEILQKLVMANFGRSNLRPVYTVLQLWKTYMLM
jgi:hypothetical protein